MNHKTVGALIVAVLLTIVLSVGISYTVITVNSSIEQRLDYNYMKDRTVIVYGESEAVTETKESKSLVYHKTGAWLGTGVVVKIDREYTYILTNAHVAGKGRPNLSLSVKDAYRTKHAELVKYHDSLDLAIIKVNGKLKDKKSITGISIANIQEKVYVVGHPLGTPFVYGEGVLAGYKNQYIYVQIPCMPGNSGSGVFNARGDLVGLLFAIDGTLCGYVPVMDVAHGIAIDGIEIQEFLKKCNLWKDKNEEEKK